MIRKLKLSPAYVSIFLSVGVFIFVLFDWLRLGSTLPPLASTASIRLTDRYGNEVRHALNFQGERQYQTPLQEIPDLLRDAFIQAEDRRFYEHHGVDWRALARGLGQSIKQGRLVSGGSTITMQLVRTQWPELRGLIHKPAQLLQALRIERTYSKGEILARYLNFVPFANQIAGVGAACRYTFGRDCAQLSPAQVAAIAILPRNPGFFSKNIAALKLRRDRLLQSLLAKSEPEILAQALAEPIHFTRDAPEFAAPHLTELVLSDLEKQSKIHSLKSAALPENKDSGTIDLSIDLEIQKRIQAELAAETRYRRGTGDTGAVLVLENKTGQVLAYVGSPDFFDPSHGMVDGVRVLRSPGSALKPFIYEFALENQWNLFDILPDIPMIFSTARAVYEPNNYGGNFSGPRTLREALANSKNIPALYLTARLGEANVLSHLRRFGFTSLTQDSQHYGVGIALGNAEVNLWELTQAYAVLARGGLHIPATWRKKTELPPFPARIIPEETAYEIADVLKDPVARQEEFGRFSPLEFDFAVGVKTGTSTDYRDHWTVGFTRQFTVGVWRGNADATPLPIRVSASRGSGPLFHRVMSIVHENRKPEWLDRPSTLTESKVCALSGHIPGKHCPIVHSELHALGRGPKKTCDFHQEVSISGCRFTYVNLPSAFEEWSKSTILPTLENQMREKCPELVTNSKRNLAGLNAQPTPEIEALPRILEPLTQTVYAIDPSIPLPSQEIRFAVRNPTSRATTLDPKSELSFYVDDVLVEKSVEEAEIFWPIQRGKHRFYVMSGEKRSNVVELHIR